VTYRKALIRPYVPEDEPLLFGLARLDRGADRRTLTVLEHETVFVAEIAGDVAGYVACVRSETGVRIDQLFVSPEHEAQGVGRQLLEYAEGWAISEDVSVLQVVVEAENARARSFYRNRGFVAVGDELMELVLPLR
jgi:GNAT superfamily N-acetyltransferase